LKVGISPHEDLYHLGFKQTKNKRTQRTTKIKRQSHTKHTQTRLAHTKNLALPPRKFLGSFYNPRPGQPFSSKRKILTQFFYISHTEFG
jgi:hypothetical protein